MASLKIKTGDTVRVITGKDKDKEGKVLSVPEADRGEPGGRDHQQRSTDQHFECYVPS